jgi:hypothetical protein
VISTSTLLNCKGSKTHHASILWQLCSVMNLPNKVLVILKIYLHVQFKSSVSCGLTLSNMTWGCSWMPPHHLYSLILMVNYSSPWWSEERSCIYKCNSMFVHFWISVDDFSWLSCFVVHNLGYLSLSDLMMKRFAIIDFWFFRLVSNDGHFKSFTL